MPPGKRQTQSGQRDAAADVSRRDFLRLGAAGAVAASACTAVPWNRGEAGEDFDHSVDVVAVGGGAAGPVAALVAARRGASVLLLEKSPIFGGTAAKSGGVYWVPNNRFERERGDLEPRATTLRNMSRASYPHLFDPEANRFGLPEREFSLIEAFYDNAWRAVEELEAMEALHSMPADVMVGPLPDYWDTREQAGHVVDRRLWPRKPDGSFGLGGEMVRQLRTGLEAAGVPILTGHRVEKLLSNARNQVVGLEARKSDGTRLRVRARKGVVFGTGGFTHNPELVLLHQPGPVFGGCAVISNEGDFVYMAQALGARLGHMGSAWRAQIVLDQALQFPSTPDDVFMPPGDSMLLVNQYAERVVNEKTNYNERTRVHYVWDTHRHEWPNLLLFMIYDRRTAELYGGRFPLPPAGTGAPYVIRGDDLDALAAAIDARLEAYGAKAGRVRLEKSFAARLAATIERFDRFAGEGIDADFRRGQRLYDREWHSKIWSFPNAGSDWPLDAPNPTLHAFEPEGPYYCIILAPGTLDTNGGPLVDARAQVVDAAGLPIPGLYGAGNCIASPTGAAYYAGGGTLGPLLAFAYLAGVGAAAEPVKELV